MAFTDFTYCSIYQAQMIYLRVKWLKQKFIDKTLCTAIYIDFMRIIVVTVLTGCGWNVLCCFFSSIFLLSSAIKITGELFIVTLSQYARFNARKQQNFIRLEKWSQNAFGLVNFQSDASISIIWLVSCFRSIYEKIDVFLMFIKTKLIKFSAFFFLSRLYGLTRKIVNCHNLWNATSIFTNDLYWLLCCFLRLFSDTLLFTNWIA